MANLISLICGDCGKNVKAPPMAAGKKIRCPSCKTVLIVPIPKAEVIETAAKTRETLTVLLIEPGEHLGQAVGYLPDGTLVVVEGGRQWIGEEVNVTVSSSFQTPAGRMVFCRID